MTFKNYTTTIDPSKTAGEIIGILARSRGVSGTTIEWNNGDPTGISFGIKTDAGEKFYRLPANAPGVLKALERDRDVPRSKVKLEHAHRVAWRVLKDWIDAQLAIIEANIVTIDQVMLPYMVVRDDGQTMYELIRERDLVAIEAGTAAA